MVRERIYNTAVICRKKRKRSSKFCLRVVLYIFSIRKIFSARKWNRACQKFQCKFIFAPVDNHNRDFRVENSFKDRQEINKELHCGSQALLFANSSSSAHRCFFSNLVRQWFRACSNSRDYRGVITQVFRWGSYIWFMSQKVYSLSQDKILAVRTSVQRGRAVATVTAFFQLRSFK